jgi:peptidoglycan hydrolase CwlO-like protein
MKTYIITERKIKLRTQEKARFLARFLAQRNNKKYSIYLCTLISEVDTKNEVVYVEGQEIDFKPKYKEALKEIEILRQTIKAKNVEIKTLKSEIDNLKTPLLKRLWAKIKNGNINIK